MEYVIPTYMRQKFGQCSFSIDSLDMGINNEGEFIAQAVTRLTVADRQLLAPVAIKGAGEHIEVKMQLPNPETGGDSGVTLEFGFDLFSRGNVLSGTDYATYDPIDDAPQAGVYRWGEQIAKAIGYFVVITAVAALLWWAAPAIAGGAAVATTIGGATALGTTQALILGGTVMAYSNMFQRVSGDLQDGNVSSHAAYAYDSVSGFAVGAAVGGAAYNISMRLAPHVASALKIKDVNYVQKLIMGGLEGAGSSFFTNVLNNLFGGEFHERKSVEQIRQEALISTAVGISVARVNLMFENWAFKHNSDYAFEHSAENAARNATGFGNQSDPNANKIRADDHFAFFGQKVQGGMERIRTLLGGDLTNRQVFQMSISPKESQKVIDAMGLSGENVGLVILNQYYIERDAMTAYMSNLFNVVTGTAGNLAGNKLNDEVEKRMYEIAGDMLEDYDLGNISRKELYNELVRFYRIVQNNDSAEIWNYLSGGFSHEQLLEIFQAW